MCRSSNMAVGLPWFFFCLFALHGALGYSKTSLEEKIENLEKKLELVYDIVTEITSENVDLKTRLKALEDLVTDGKHFERESGNPNAAQMTFPLRTNSSNNQINKNIDERKVTESDIKNNISLERKRKDYVTILPSTSTPSVIAFHAYLSKDSSGPLGAHHILQFDVVPLNRGNGYNVFDGIFIVPATGTYVFTWSFMSEGHGRVDTQLMKNADIIGTRYADSLFSTVWDFATGTVVTEVNQGDHVYVRLGLASTRRVRSIPESRTTFSGWLLS
uniref:C1q domain-containing protein n=3 Tax=Magallana gigas TaxID=29159 RepID=A0A8W8NUU4_MAGGI|nr:complement C1q-like protein 2 [Crassostrea gigas]